MKNGVQEAFLNSFGSLARQLGVFFIPRLRRPLPVVDAPEMAIAKGAKQNVSSLNSRQSSLGGDQWKCVLHRAAGAVIRAGWQGTARLEGEGCGVIMGMRRLLGLRL